jgi:hypothetical protein
MHVDLLAGGLLAGAVGAANLLPSAFDSGAAL